jgi:hypothetical protein
MTKNSRCDTWQFCCVIKIGSPCARFSAEPGASIKGGRDRPVKSGDAFDMRSCRSGAMSSADGSGVSYDLEVIDILISEVQSAHGSIAELIDRLKLQNTGVFHAPIRMRIPEGKSIGDLFFEVLPASDAQDVVVRKIADAWSVEFSALKEMIGLFLLESVYGHCAPEAEAFMRKTPQ